MKPVFTIFGIWVLTTAILFLMLFGILFLVDIAHHQPAHFGKQAAFVLIPVFLSVFTGFMLAANIEEFD